LLVFFLHGSGALSQHSPSHIAELNNDVKINLRRPAMRTGLPATFISPYETFAPAYRRPRRRVDRRDL